VCDVLVQLGIRPAFGPQKPMDTVLKGHHGVVGGLDNQDISGHFAHSRFDCGERGCDEGAEARNLVCEYSCGTRVLDDEDPA
jgi:hypothetical protein